MRVEDVLSDAFTVFKKHWITFLIATLIAVVGSIFIITFRPLFWGLYIIALMSIRGEEVEIGDVFKGFNHFIKSWTIFIIGAILVFIGFIFLIIPGLLLWMLFQYAIPIALIQNKGAVESLQLSFEIGKENLQFTVILWIVLAFINIIGYTVSVGWLITEPFTAICLCIATLKLTEAEQKIKKKK
jgi:uncharacterized membrane protein